MGSRTVFDRLPLVYDLPDRIRFRCYLDRIQRCFDPRHLHRRLGRHRECLNHYPANH